MGPSSPAPVLRGAGPAQQAAGSGDLDLPEFQIWGRQRPQKVARLFLLPPPHPRSTAAYEYAYIMHQRLAGAYHRQKLPLTETAGEGLKKEEKNYRC
jgi:hypothetical protein